MNLRIRVRQWDWLLIIGAMLAPMTGLRIWKIGPAEVLCFIWALRYITFKRVRLNFLVKYFIVFIFCMFLGTLICSNVAPEEVRLESWPTWIFLVIISCVLLRVVEQNNLDYNIKVFDLICCFSTLWYAFLYLFSRTVSRSFLGAPLWYYYRYAGGGTNPHQLAVLMCGIEFWYVYKFSKRRKIVDVVFFLLTLFLLSETKSSTGIAAIAVGIFIYIAIWLIESGRSSTQKTLFLSIEFIVIVMVVVLFYRQLYQMVYEWVSEDANGLGRFYIWSSFKQAILKSPLVGLGPGTHGISYSGIKEFHNSYLEIFAASGIVGFIAFIVLTIIIVRKVLQGYPKLLPIIVAMYGYSMAGFAFRRLAYWIVMIFTIVIAEQIGRETAVNEANLATST